MDVELLFYNLAKCLLNIFPSKEIRHKLRVENYVHLQNRIAKYLKNNYIQLYKKNLLDNFNLAPQIDLGTEKIIWQYWGQGIDDNLPDVVKTCFKSVDKYAGDYKIIRLSNDNIREYINFPDFVFEKLGTNFSYTFFSDLLRVTLLSLYGGIWIDATILLSDNLPNSLTDKEFFMYQRGNKPDDYKVWESLNREYFCWKTNARVKCLNSFIIAKKNNKMVTTIRDILLNYYNRENRLYYYFLFQVLFDELLKDPEYSFENCEIISDIIPHIMALHAYEKFDGGLLEKIKTETCLHKLTYFNNQANDSLAAYILKNGI